MDSSRFGVDNYEDSTNYIHKAASFDIVKACSRSSIVKAIVSWKVIDLEVDFENSKGTSLD